MICFTELLFVSIGHLCGGCIRSAILKRHDFGNIVVTELLLGASGVNGMWVQEQCELQCGSHLRVRITLSRHLQITINRYGEKNTDRMA